MKDFWKSVWNKFSSVATAALLICSIMCIVLVISGCISIPTVEKESDLTAQPTVAEQPGDTENCRRISGSGWGICDITDYVDPETGVHYLLYDGDSGVGICPRYDKTGALMITEIP